MTVGDLLVNYTNTETNMGSDRQGFEILPHLNFDIFFFFHWHYSPLWALACRTMSFHFFLSATNSLHLLTPSIWRSLSTSSFHLFLGLLLLLLSLLLLLLLLPLALQPTVGFGLSKNVFPFFPICHQLSPSSHSQHLKISFYFLIPSFPWSTPSSRPFPFFLGILSSSILSRCPNQLILCLFLHFTIFSPLLISSSSRFVRIFHFPFSYLRPHVPLNIFRVW